MGPAVGGGGLRGVGVVQDVSSKSQNVLLQKLRQKSFKKNDVTRIGNVVRNLELCRQRDKTVMFGKCRSLSTFDSHHRKEFQNFRLYSIVTGWDGLGVGQIDVLILAVVLTVFDLWQVSILLCLLISEVWLLIGSTLLSN